MKKDSITSCSFDAASWPAFAQFSYQVDYFPPFDEPSFQPMRDVICQVLRDLACTIVPTNDPCTGLPPILRISVDTTIVPNRLGSASAYYYNFSRQDLSLTGYAHGNVWRVLNGGSDNLTMPLIVSNDPLTDVYHGTMRFNPNFNWNFDMEDTTFVNSAAALDFYQVVLHEAVHMLGIASWIDQDGSSRVSPPTTAPFGLYTRFDRYLEEHIGGNQLLNNADSCYSVDFVSNANLLTGGCDQVDFQGINYFPFIDLGIFTPGQWRPGSSMSHFGNDSCAINHYLMHASIHNNPAGHAIRRPTDAEFFVLCELGYQFSNNYGDGTLPFHTFNNGVMIPDCGSRSAGNDDTGPNCDSLYVISCNFPFEIAITDVLANDYNVQPFIDCVIPIVGSPTFTLTSTHIIITDATPGINALAYLPTSPNGEQANMTVIYFWSELCCLEIPDTCNAVMNPEIILPIGCPPNTQNLWSINAFCPEFDNNGWMNVFGSADYFTNNLLPSGPDPLSGTALGFRTYIQPTDADLLGEGVAASVHIEPNKRYIGSVVKVLEPQHPLGIRQDLEQFHMGLSNNIVSVNSYDYMLPNDLVDIYTELNMENEDWNQAFFCIDPLDTTYCNMLIYGNNITNVGLGTLSTSYTLIDRLDIMPDNFPQDITVIDTAAVCCINIELGDSLCQSLPNLIYSWQMLSDSAETTTWADIDTIQTPYYQVERCDTGCVWYRLLRGVDANPSLPLSNWQCLLDTAYFKICVTNADTTITDNYDLNCCLAMADSLYTYFTPTGGITTISDPTATLNYTAPVVIPAATVTWTSGSNPFNNAIGTPANPIFINGTITIPTNADIIIDGLYIEFGPMGRIQVLESGRLTLKNCEFNGLSQCKTMWQGMQTQALSSSKTGKLLITENTQIKHAIIGAANTLMPLFDFGNFAPLSSVDNTAMWSPLSLWLLQVWSGAAVNNAGGQVSIINSKMIDCFHGALVVWRSFSNNQCLFRESLFQYSGLNQWFPLSDIQDRTETGIFGMSLQEIGDTRNCLFDRLKYGARAIGVNHFAPYKNNFQNCRVGISTTQFDVSLNSTDMKENNFFRCIIGIQADGMSNLTINNNQVNPDLLGASEKAIGFYIRGSDSQILNNHINKTAFGMVITDNGQEGSLIAGNTMANNSFALTAEGDNTGVEIKCNHLVNYIKRGFDIRQYAATSENGDLGQQGDCDLTQQPAANTFIPAPGAFDLYFGDNTNNLTYQDVIATTLSKGNGAINYGDCICTDCNSINIDEFCASQGFVSIADIDLITDDIRKNRELSKLLFAYIADNDYTAAYQLLHNYYSTMTQRKLVSLKIEEGKLDSAQLLLNQLPDNSDEQLQFKLYHNLLMDLKAEERDIFNLNEAEIDLLNSIANSRTKTAYRAQALLFVARGQQFETPLPADEDGAAWHTVFKTNDHNSSAQVSDFAPNPATNSSQLLYNLAQGQTANLAIYDYMGRTIESQQLTGMGNYTLNMQHYTTGMYCYTLTIDGTAVKSGKLLLIK